MNIFEIYLNKITNLIKKLNNDGKLLIPSNLNGINVDIPPPKFDCDLSTNVAMVLSKLNKKPPTDIANLIIKEINKEKNIENIFVEKPGFINFKFKKIFWSNFLLEVINNSKNYGINNKLKKKKYLLEFVSANPTGPLHVGHCRGAVLGDVLSNLLLFNKNEVTKEYYVNDFGGQISHFTKSIFFRIREILFKEEFPKNDAELYPGNYLINLAILNII